MYTDGASHWNTDTHQWVQVTNGGVTKVYRCDKTCGHVKCERGIWLQLADMCDSYEEAYAAEISALVEKMFT